METHPELQIKQAEANKKLTGKQLFEKDKEGKMLRSEETAGILFI